MTQSPAASSPFNINRVTTHVEVISSSNGAVSDFRRGWAAAVVENLSAVHREIDLPGLAELGEQLGEVLARHAIAALGCGADDCRSYGKGAIVGTALTIEHAAAILHPRMGAPIRAALGRGKAIIPSTVKHGGPGAHLDVPLHGIDDEWDFVLLDSIEAFVSGSPRQDEVVVIVAFGTGRADAVVGKLL